MRLVLDGRYIQTREELHNVLSRGLDLPSWYGRNLDALSDYLTTCHRETELILVRQSELENSLGRYAFVFERVLSICAEGNPYIKVQFETQPQLPEEDDE